MKTFLTDALKMIVGASGIIGVMFIIAWSNQNYPEYSIALWGAVLLVFSCWFGFLIVDDRWRAIENWWETRQYLKRQEQDARRYAQRERELAEAHRRGVEAGKQITQQPNKEKSQ